MNIEIQAKSILRRSKRIESWFMTHYGMNLYRGCTHNCAYCDGRADSYNVKGEFGKDVGIKINAIDLLDRELNPKRKRNPMPKSFVMLGGGVCDAYQAVEEKYQLARQALEIIQKHKYPVHILTKSTLIERDIDLLKEINQQSRAIVSFSFSSTEDKISKIFEPGVPSTTERLATIKKLKKEGISCGMFLMPVIPFITDTPAMLDKSLKDGKAASIDFVIFSTMTMKVGRQKAYFMKRIHEYFPELASKYNEIYPTENQWGSSIAEYNKPVHDDFERIASRYKIPKRMPPKLYKDIIDKEDLIIVILEHLDYLSKLKNKNSPYGYAAYSLSKLTEPISSFSQQELLKLKGVGPVTARIIKEIVNTGACAYYESLI